MLSINPIKPKDLMDSMLQQVVYEINHVIAIFLCLLFPCPSKKVRDHLGKLQLKSLQLSIHAASKRIFRWQQRKQLSCFFLQKPSATAVRISFLFSTMLTSSFTPPCVKGNDKPVLGDGLVIQVVQSTIDCY